MSDDDRKYHLGFGRADLPQGATTALLSGDPDRSRLIAEQYLTTAAWTRSWGRCPGAPRSCARRAAWARRH
jgi:hypothetical protein